MTKIKCGSRSTGKTEEDFDPYWLDVGEKVEYEHTCNKSEARRIAMDHLEEFEDYYKELDKMEKKLEAKKSRLISDNKHKPKKEERTPKFKINTKLVADKSTEDVEDNMEKIVKVSKSSKQKVINNLNNNFKYKKVK